jgi:Ca2+-binding RTX toxin-like protein
LPTLQAKANSAFNYTVAANTITDPDAWDSITYSVKMADGSAVPAWLTFDALTRTLSGTPGAAGTLQFILWGTDNYGSAAGEYVNMTIAAPNRTPVLSTALLDQSAAQGGAFSYTVPATAFADPDSGDTLTYSATLADGSALPSWLVFNAATRAFSGTPPTTGTLSVKVIAKDSGNLSAFDIFDVVVSVQNLLLNGTASAETLTGGSGHDTLNGLAGNDTLNGGAGNDLLDGGLGNDAMTGGLGNDTYVIDSISDGVNELVNEGTDLVQSSISYTLAANVENLTLTGTSALNGTGNALNNVLTGNAGANTLDGGAGADTMVGGAGNDTYYVDNAGDLTTEAASAGTDTVVSSINWTLGTNLENLTLNGTANINATGNTVANVLTGNAGDNVLNGGAGADTLIGGAGNDTYVIDMATDVVTEGLNAGIDLVQSSITTTLTANVENLTLTGTAAIKGNGNALDNVLTGNTGINVLTGGAGNDTYVVGTGDTTIEAASAGVDTVQSAIAWTLASNVENLTLTGTTAINGTGNTLNNVLLGNAGVNTLTGNAGNDTLNGGAGNDILIGGTGNDSYWLGRGYGGDSITENDATVGNTDVARFDTGIATDQLWFIKTGNNLEVSVIGTTDKFTLNNWYLSNQYHVEQFKTSDGKTLLDSQVQNLVSAMAAFAPPAAGQTTLAANYATALTPVIVANWH